MFNTNYKKFKIYESGFSYEETSYVWSEVSSIAYCHIKTTQSINFVKQGEPESAELAIKLTNGTKLSIIFNEATLIIGWKTDKQEDIKNLYEAFKFISTNTFNFRLKQYEDQIKKSGEFQYDDDIRFIVAETIICGEKKWNINELAFIRKIPYLHFQKLAPTFWDKLLIKIIGIPGILIVWDTDVLFYLLEKYFSLKFQTGEEIAMNPVAINKLIGQTKTASNLIN